MYKFETKTNEGAKLQNNYYSFADTAPYPNGDFSIIHNEFGIMIKFIEQSFTGLDAYLSVKNGERYTKHKLFRKDKNILQTSLIDARRYMDIEEIQIHYKNTPEIVLRKNIYSKT